MPDDGSSGAALKERGSEILRMSKDDIARAASTAHCQPKQSQGLGGGASRDLHLMPQLREEGCGIAG